jgi:hypothetical protein
MRDLQRVALGTSAAGAVGTLTEMTRDVRPTICSALLYTLAFNLTFFIQELFLVLPKAFTPGLRPTLFHNNHTWQGEHPLASLFQGTGALAIFLTGLGCALLLRRPSARSATVQLFLIWMAYNGFFQSLPQVVIGALNPRNDVGMAMQYLHLGAAARTIAAIFALTVMPLVAAWLARYVLRLAKPDQFANGSAQARFMFSIATLPALVAIPLIIAFRVPRNVIEVVVVPVVVTIVGVIWMQAGAWWLRAEPSGTAALRMSIAVPLAAVLILLLVFHFVLRPGIPFF